MAPLVLLVPEVPWYADLHSSITLSVHVRTFQAYLQALMISLFVRFH